MAAILSGMIGAVYRLLASNAIRLMVLLTSSSDILSAKLYCRSSGAESRIALNKETVRSLTAWARSLYSASFLYQCARGQEHKLPSKLVCNLMSPLGLSLSVLYWSYDHLHSLGYAILVSCILAKLQIHGTVGILCIRGVAPIASCHSIRVVLLSNTRTSCW